MAVKEGFEPSIPVIRYGSLAGNWFQPLTHFTELRLDKLLNLFGHHNIIDDGFACRCGQ